MCVLCVLVSGGAPRGRRQVGLCVFCVYLLVWVHLEAGGFLCVLCVLVNGGAPGGRNQVGVP